MSLIYILHPTIQSQNTIIMLQLYSAKWFTWSQNTEYIQPSTCVSVWTLQLKKRQILGGGQEITKLIDTVIKTIIHLIQL